MLAEDTSYRVRLEGRAELLDKTRLRYRALKQMLGSLLWRRKLRRNEPLLREVIALQPRVDQALGVVEKKAAAEGWLEGSETLKCAREVDELKHFVYRLMGRKLKRAAARTFSERLMQLERLAVAGPRRVYPGERWKTALEALPLWLPEVEQLKRFGEVTESLFKRPYIASQRLPFTGPEVARLEAIWPEGEAALTTTWARLAGVDTTDGVARMLKRRAGRTPMKLPQNGPEMLMRAEFWRNYALARLRELTAARISPVQLADGELLPVARWLAERERSALTQLTGLPESRAGLISLAAELWLAVAQKSPNLLEQLYDQARAADQTLQDDADLGRLRDNLRMMLAVLGRDTRRPLDRRAKRYEQRQETSTLAGMVSELRARLLEQSAK